MLILISGIGAFLLALTHFFADKLKLSYIPRSKWLSAAGGISVSYVFIEMIPEMKEWQEAFEESRLSGAVGFMEKQVYLVTLLGLMVFYGLERAAKISKASGRKAAGGKAEMSPNTDMFWVHISSLSIYNLLISYLLINREDNSITSILLFVLAMAFHFLVNDYGLMEHYGNDYRQKGRWIITSAILLGWLTGVLTEIPEVYISLIFAFIAGGVIMNVLKEELPEERKSNFWYFAIGITGYTALLLML